MELYGNIITGIFRERPNRYLALVDIGNDTRVPCFVPNPGRMVELLLPRAKVVLSEVPSGRKRKTKYDLIGVQHGNQLVSIDSRVPSKLVHEALQNDELDEFIGYDTIKLEQTYRNSRLDFLLSAMDQKDCFLEVKSCTLVKGERALFPDAPTERGRRHMLDLIAARKDGYRACVLFLVQRMDAQVFSPNDPIDPKFGEALRAAATHGVEIYSYAAAFKENEITIERKLVVDLGEN